MAEGGRALALRQIGPEAPAVPKSSINVIALEKMLGESRNSPASSLTPVERGDAFKVWRANGERTIASLKVLLSEAQELKLNAKLKAERGALSGRGLATELFMANVASSLGASVLETWAAAGGRDGCSPEQADPEAMQDAITAGNSLLERARIAHLTELRGYPAGDLEDDSIRGHVMRVETEVFAPVKRLLEDPARRLNISKKLPELESLKLISESEARDGTFS